MATRKASGKPIQRTGDAVPSLVEARIAELDSSSNLVALERASIDLSRLRIGDADRNRVPGNARL